MSLDNFLDTNPNGYFIQVHSKRIYYVTTTPRFSHYGVYHCTTVNDPIFTVTDCATHEKAMEFYNAINFTVSDACAGKLPVVYHRHGIFTYDRFDIFENGEKVGYSTIPHGIVWAMNYYRSKVKANIDYLGIIRSMVSG